MSWDADLIDEHGDVGFEQNYTHNCNGMIAQALKDADNTYTPMCWEGKHPLNKAIGPAWWRHLDGMTGEDSKAFLGKIVAALEKDPPKFQAMNPPNGWGSYETLLPVLRKMRDVVPDRPTVWSASG